MSKKTLELELDDLYLLQLERMAEEDEHVYWKLARQVEKMIEQTYQKWSNREELEQMAAAQQMGQQVQVVSELDDDADSDEE